MLVQCLALSDHTGSILYLYYFALCCSDSLYYNHPSESLFFFAHSGINLERQRSQIFIMIFLIGVVTEVHRKLLSPRAVLYCNSTQIDSICLSVSGKLFTFCGFK